MALNYSWSWLAKLTLQREINEGAGEKMPNDMSAKWPSVTDFMEGLAWDPTPSVPVAAWCKPFVGHREHVGHVFRCDFGDARGAGLALLVVG